MERPVGLRERMSVFEGMFRSREVLSSSCYELRKFLEYAAPLAWDGSMVPC